MCKKMNEDELKRKNALKLIQKWISEVESNQFNQEVIHDVTKKQNE